jgi:hypothetical protein
MEYTQEQEAGLAELRAAFGGKTSDKGFPLNDPTFLRYLRARKGNVAAAKKQLEATIKWRVEAGLSDLYEQKWESVIANENSTGKCYVRGFDRAGHPLLYMKPRFENTKDHDGIVLAWLLIH